VFELTDASVDPEWLLDAVAAAGYAGIDLGPPGYLGTGDELRRRLDGRGLALAGGWIQLEPGPAGEEALQASLACFDAVGGPDQAPPPRPTLATDGPAHAVTGAPGQLDADDWRAMTERLSQAVTTCRSRGYEPTFHHHVGTWVETPDQVERLLEDVDVDLCFDTGHLVLGGGAPLEHLTRWWTRINHVHLKDVDLEAAGRLASAHEPLLEVWRRGVFRRFGDGHVDIDRMLESLEGLGGWLVVEQDTLRGGAAGLAAADRDQRHNRRYLEARGW
jgi:inosose dehydratase